MAEYIPFLTNDDGLGVTSSIFTESAALHLPLPLAVKWASHIPTDATLWIDPLVDGFDDAQIRGPDEEKSRKATPWYERMKGGPHFADIASPSFQAAPQQGAVTSFVNWILDQCSKLNPAYITVPQLPFGEKSERNKLNRMMAAATAEWKSKNKKHCRFILPVIFKKISQTAQRKDRKPRIDLIERCYLDSDAVGFWIADTTLQDEAQGVDTRRARFIAAIKLHEEINEKLSSELKIGGPYWAFNLLLWARGLIDNPAIGLGSGYRCFLSGLPVQSPPVRIVIPCLKRRILHENLLPWVDKAMAKLGPSHPAFGELDYLKRAHGQLSDAKRAKLQVNHFYKAWFNRLETIPKDGRSMALYQDFSAAYALGKVLPEISGEDGPIRPAASIVEPLMLSCL